MTGMFLTLILFLSFYLYKDSDRVLNDQAKMILENTSEKNQINFNYSIQETENTAFDIINSNHFTEFIQRYATNQVVNDNSSFDFQTTILPKIRQLLVDSHKVENVEVYLQDQGFKISQFSFKLIEGFKEERELPVYHWESENNQRSLVLPFNAFDINLRKKGFIRLTVNPNFFFQSINENDKQQNGFIILDRNDIAIYDPLENSEFSNIQVDGPNSPNPVVEHNFLFNQVELSNGWKSVTYYSLDSFQIDTSNFFHRVIVVSLIIMMSSLVFGKVFSHWFVRPIRYVNQHIQNNDKNQLPEKIPVISEDEIGKLIRSYNRMVSDLSELFEQNKLEEQAKHDAQLSAYQAQIQPHFLYNTLAIISWTAKKEDFKKVEEITKNLAKYYRLVLAKGKQITSLQEELDLVFYYLEIQKIRFSDQLTAEIEVEAGIDTKNLYIMHRILQPMVENALEHGIFPKGSGKIKVTVFQDEKKLYIYIADNGMGASPDTVDKINKLEKVDTENGGFSLISIILALKSYYRSAISITFDSVEGKGTTVEIAVEKMYLLPR